MYRKEKEIDRNKEKQRGETSVVREGYWCS